LQLPFEAIFVPELYRTALQEETFSYVAARFASANKTMLTNGLEKIARKGICKIGLRILFHLMTSDKELPLSYHPHF
jgi:hypothetical protein